MAAAVTPRNVAAIAINLIAACVDSISARGFLCACQRCVFGLACGTDCTNAALGVCSIGDGAVQEGGHAIEVLKGGCVFTVMLKREAIYPADPARSGRARCPNRTDIDDLRGTRLAFIVDLRSQTKSQHWSRSVHF